MAVAGPVALGALTCWISLPSCWSARRSSPKNVDVRDHAGWRYSALCRTGRAEGFGIDRALYPLGAAVAVYADPTDGESGIDASRSVTPPQRAAPAGPGAAGSRWRQRDFLAGDARCQLDQLEPVFGSLPSRRIGDDGLTTPTPVSGRVQAGRILDPVEPSFSSRRAPSAPPRGQHRQRGPSRRPCP